MNTIARKALILAAALGLIVGASSCIMEERVIEFVVQNGTCEEFFQYSEAVHFASSAQVDYAHEIEMALEDNDVSREDIVSARLVSASYEVTAFTQSHDWTVTGAITVERDDIAEGPDNLISYTDQSVEGALGKVIPAHLNEAGVALMNKALEDFIANVPGTNNPILTVRVDNGSVSPAPSHTDPIQFTWRACVVVHIVTKKDIDVPDPF